MNITATFTTVLAACLLAFPVRAASPPRSVPVIEAPAGPVRCRAIEEAPPADAVTDRIPAGTPTCLVPPPGDLGTLVSTPNGAMIWLPPHAAEGKAPPRVFTALPHMITQTRTDPPVEHRL